VLQVGATGIEEEEEEGGYESYHSMSFDLGC
jgi:hypothetical protein